MPAKGPSCLALRWQTDRFRGQAPLLQDPHAAIDCGTIPATFSHTRIDHAHERPPHSKTCAQEARHRDTGQSR
ncbi:hypothetical protein C1X37_00930 [Pseudomonas sp. FW305-3-2-15-A-R2A1]|nr:hypothetical protein C1X37_00930 [Pseudomonas sp. FW305-3-2-15-A-R2A1]